jgi:hypothetical protein
MLVRVISWIRRPNQYHAGKSNQALNTSLNVLHAYFSIASITCKSCMYHHRFRSLPVCLFYWQPLQSRCSCWQSTGFPGEEKCCSGRVLHAEACALVSLPGKRVLHAEACALVSLPGKRVLHAEACALVSLPGKGLAVVRGDDYYVFK